MGEVVGAFPSTDLRYERTNCAVETRNGARGNLAQQRFEFAVGQLDRVEVGRVLRQIANRRPRFLDRLSNAGDQVDSAIVHDDDVVAPERRNQTLLDIGEEHLSGQGTLDHHRRGHLIVAQGGHEGDRLPLPKWDAADQPDAARCTPPQPHQIGADRSLIDEHQSGGVKHALLPDPASARAGHVRSLPLRRLQAFFLKVMSWRAKKRESALLLVRMRRRRSSATVSIKVRSGCSAITANTRAAHFSNGETLPPRAFGAALLLSCQRCNHLTAEATLTSKRSAASCRDAPISTASITRSRRSAEYDLGIVRLRKGESMPTDSPIPNPKGIPSIQIRREPL